MPLCCDCRKNVPKASFVKSQLKKPQGKRRCIPCAKPLSAANDAVASEGATCWICLQKGHDEHGPPRRECSCRGTTGAGYVHMSCLIDMASKKADSIDIGPNVSLGVSVSGNTINPWSECMTCRQAYRGITMYRLATAMFKKYAAEDQPVFWKGAAYDNVSGALLSTCDPKGAEMVIEKWYKICKDDYRKEVNAGVSRSEISSARYIASCCIRLVECYRQLGRYEDMPPKLDEAEKYAKYVNDDGGRLRANIWRTRAQYEQATDHPEEAMKLLERVIFTLATKNPGYEGSLNNLRDLWLLSKMMLAAGETAGYRMMKNTISAAKRILGDDHPALLTMKDEFKKYERLGDIIKVRKCFKKDKGETIATGFLYTRQIVRLSRVLKAQGGYSGSALKEDGEWEKLFVPFSAVCLDEGTRVVLVDFEKSEKQHNGKRGVVRGFEFENNETNSFDALTKIIALEDGKGEISVKPKNLMVDVPGVDFRAETRDIF